MRGIEKVLRTGGGGEEKGRVGRWVQGGLSLP